MTDSRRLMRRADAVRSISSRFDRSLVCANPSRISASTRTKWSSIASNRPSIALNRLSTASNRRSTASKRSSISLKPCFTATARSFMSASMESNRVSTASKPCLTAVASSSIVSSICACIVSNRLSTASNFSSIWTRRKSSFLSIRVKLSSIPRSLLKPKDPLLQSVISVQPGRKLLVHAEGLGGEPVDVARQLLEAVVRD